MIQQNEEVYGRFVLNGKSYRLNPQPDGWSGVSEPILHTVSINDKPVWLIDDKYWQEEKGSDKELPFDVDIAFYAFRYCLGRATYVVYDMAQYLINHADIIDEKHRALIIAEINAAIEKKQAGWAMDVKEWERVLARLQASCRVLARGDWYTAYAWEDQYYLPNMRQYINKLEIVEIIRANGAT